MNNHKSSLLQMALLLIVMASLPLGLNLLKQRTNLGSKASSDPIVFKEGSGVVFRQGHLVAISPDINMELVSPLGPPAASASASLPLDNSKKNIVSTFLENHQIIPLAQAQTTPNCFGFSASGLNSSSQNQYGGTRYIVSDSSFGTDTLLTQNLSFSSSPTGTTLETPTSSPSNIIQASLNGSGFLVNIPRNNTQATIIYRIDARVILTATNGTKTYGPCNPITIEVQAPIAIPPSPSPSPSPTPGSIACSDFILEGAVTADGIINGGKSFRVSSNGGQFFIKADSLTANQFTPTSSLTVQKTPNGQNWIVDAPANTSTSQVQTYTISGTISLNGQTATCNPITLHVSKKDTGVCDYQSTEIKFQNPENPGLGWRTTSTIVLGKSINIAAFHTQNNIPSNTPATDVGFTYQGANENGNLTLVSGITKLTPNPGTLTQNEDYTINVFTNDQSGNGCTSSKIIAVTPPAFVTKSFKISETREGLSSAPTQPYTQEPMQYSFKLQNTTPGTKNIFVQFIGTGTDGSAKTADGSGTIEYVGPDPQIDSIVCSPDISSSGIIAQINGKNFGVEASGSAIMINNSPATILGDWSDSKISAKVENLISQKENNPVFTINLTRADNQKTLSKCSLGLSQLSLGAQSMCGDLRTDYLSQKSADITIVDSAGRVAKETVIIDGDGFIRNLKTKLEKNQRYKISVKAPGILRRMIEFTAKEGTTVVNGSRLPMGDLNSDGRINVADYQNLRGIWSSSRQSSSSQGSSSQSNFGQNLNSPSLSSSDSATFPVSIPVSIPITTPIQTSNVSIETADLNGDGIVNGFDLSCLLRDFNKNDDTEDETPPGPEITPSASPVSSPIASSSAEPASPSATPAH